MSTAPIAQGPVEVNVSPQPLGHHVRLAGHHWLERLDIDGHSFGLVCLQWNPCAKKWSHSGNVGTNLYVETQGWRYVERCPMPDEG